MSGPRISTGTDSKQDYQTPKDFIAAVTKRFGPIEIDLAAHAGNHQAARYFTPREFVRTSGSKKDGTYAESRVPNDDAHAEAFDSFAQLWHRAAPGKLLWLNPEFADIAPWAKKCADEMLLGAETTLLVPAAVGSNWFCDHVGPLAMTYLLNGRLCFDGKNPFPKDCLLAHFRQGQRPGFRVWDWRRDRILLQFNSWHDAPLFPSSTP